MIPLLDTITGLAKTALDKWIPDANVREQVAVELAKQAYKEVELEIQDRASARSREMAVKDWVPGALALVVTACFLGGTFWFAYNPPAPASTQLVHDMILTVRDGWFAVVMYYFGSSLGSRQKTALNGGSK